MATAINSELCYRIICQYGQKAVQEALCRESGKALEQVMDAIFIYAGMTSILGGGEHVAVAHALFEGFTAVDKTRDYGHGLLVGFGNLCMLAIENYSQTEMIEEILLAKSCGIPVDIAEIAGYLPMSWRR